MTMTQSLLDFILSLLRDDAARAAFDADPQRALAEAGLSDVCSEDVADAMSYVAEYHPVSFVGEREYNVGNSAISQHASNHDNGDHGGWHEGPHFDPHADVVQRLEYISNNYTFSDSHDTVIDKSVNQSIWNEGNLSQRFDDHSVTATDHSVAAGRDIYGNVANGDGNVVGDGNSVGNTYIRDDHSDDHSIHGSFNGNNLADHGGVAGDGNQVADHGGIAGDGNDGNVTNPHHSAVATNGSELDASTHDSHDKTIVKDSGNSWDHSGNTIVKDSGNSWDHSGNVHETNIHENIHDDSQHADGGLVNINARDVVHTGDVNALDDIHLLGH